MADYNSSCNLSNLSIKDNEEVYLILLKKNHSPKERVVLHPFDNYLFNMLPLEGLYDGIGGIYKVKDTISKNILEKALCVDIETLLCDLRLKDILSQYSDLRETYMDKSIEKIFHASRFFSKITEEDLTILGFEREEVNVLGNHIATKQYAKYIDCVDTMQVIYYIVTDLEEHFLVSVKDDENSNYMNIRKLNQNFSIKKSFLKSYFELTNKWIGVEDYHNEYITFIHQTEVSFVLKSILDDLIFERITNKLTKTEEEINQNANQYLLSTLLTNDEFFNKIKVDIFNDEKLGLKKSSNEILDSMVFSLGEPLSLLNKIMTNKKFLSDYLLKPSDKEENYNKNKEELIKTKKN